MGLQTSLLETFSLRIARSGSGGHGERFWSRGSSLLRSLFRIPVVILTIGILFLSQTSWADEEGTVVTLTQAVKEAIRHNPVLQASRKETQSRREGIEMAQADYFPQLSVNYQNAVGNGFMGFFLFPGYNSYDFELLTVTMTQNIWDFGRREADVAQNRWSSKNAREEEKGTIQKIIRDTEVAYLTLLSAQHEEKAARQSLTDALRHLDIVQLQYNNGKSVRVVLTQAEVNVEEARLGLVNAIELRKAAAVTLARLLGENPQNHPLQAVDPAVIPNIEPVDLRRDVTLALRNRPDLKGMAAQVHMQESALDRVQDANLPKITAVGQYFLAQLPFGALPMPVVPSNSGFYSTYNVGGVVSIPLFEGGRLLHQYHQAHEKLQESRFRMDDARLKVEKDVVLAALRVETARQRWVVAQEALEKARENDRLLEQAFATGAARSIDVLDAETALRKAREDALSARYGWAMALTNYRYSLGMLKAPAFPLVYGSGH